MSRSAGRRERAGNGSAWYPRRPQVAAVAVGGMLGAAARYAIGLAWPTPPRGWPTGTLVANLAGALLLGVLVGVLARAGPDDGWRLRLRLFVGTGFCGALTTYSALAVETDLLAARGQPVLAVAYPVVSVLGGLAAVGVGLALAASVRRPA